MLADELEQRRAHCQPSRDLALLFAGARELYVALALFAECEALQ
jgi:hypothetical protein